MKKIILPGLIAGLAMLIFDFASTYLYMFIPAMYADYGNAAIMRNWSDPKILLLLLYPFVLGVSISWLWSKTHNLLRGSLTRKALGFTISYFIIATIPSMLATYGALQLSGFTVAAWTANGFIEPFLTCLIIATMRK